MDSGNEVVHSDINEPAELARVRPFLRTLRPLRQLVYCAYFVTIPIGSWGTRTDGTSDPWRRVLLFGHVVWPAEE